MNSSRLIYGSPCELVEIAAWQGHVAAQIELADMLARQERDGEARKWYQLAGRYGDSIGDQLFGHIQKYEVHGDMANAARSLRRLAVLECGEAVAALRRGAENGEIIYQRYLGEMYNRGAGVAWDEAESLKWYYLAASQGCAESQVVLGLKYYSGNGVMKDMGEAFKWFSRSADNGNETAQSYLGHQYASGEGVVRNKDKAVEYLYKAAIRGQVCAKNKLDELCGTKDWMREIMRDEFARLYTDAWHYNVVEAQVILGLMYFYGRGLEENQDAADACFKLAADQGDICAKNNYGGQTMNLRYEYRTLEWYSDLAKSESGRTKPAGGIKSSPGVDPLLDYICYAAENGHAEAQYILGCWLGDLREWEKFKSRMSEDPEPEKESPAQDEQELMWFSRAAAQGHVGALDKIGSVNSGAERWFRLAEENS